MEKNTINSQMKRLEDIVSEMKKEDLGLEKSLELYEEGMNLSKKLNEMLEKAELKVRILTKEGALEPLSAEAEEA